MAIAYYVVWLRWDAHRQKAAAIALQAVAAILVVYVGILGVSSGSGLRKLAATFVDIHALFGLLLCALIFLRFRWRIRYVRPAHPSELRELTRHLSRIVYLSLYLVIGAKQVIGIVDWLSRGSEFGSGRIITACASADCAALGPTKDFQAILIYGILTLVLIRGLTFSFSLRAFQKDIGARRRQPIPYELK